MSMKRTWIAVLLVAGCGDTGTDMGVTPTDGPEGPDMSAAVVDMAAAVGDMAAPTGDMGDAGAPIGDAAARDGALPDGALPDGGEPARGEYLVKHVLFCGSCHTTPDAMGNASMDPTKFLAGGRVFTVTGGDAGMITIRVPNITPDKATGIGNWGTDQLRNAIKMGVDNTGRPLFPIMPYYQFALLSDDDATAIAVYLKTIVTAQSNAVAANPALLPMPAPALDDTKIPHTTLAANDPNFASAERGRYLVKVSCTECHTMHNASPFPSVLDLSKAYAGGETFPLAPGFTTVSANITPDATGLPGWTAGDVKNTLLLDKEKGTGRTLCPPMPGGANAAGGMTDGDLTDVSNFVHTLPPIKNGPFGCTDGGVPFGAPDGGL